MSDVVSRIRIDKWLFFARVVKSRTLSQRLLRDGKVRVNNVRILTPGRLVGIGDVVTVTGYSIRVFRILDVGSRRGPASEACLLYEDLSPPPPSPSSSSPSEFLGRVRGSGRPTKKDRRALDKFRSGRI